MTTTTARVAVAPGPVPPCPPWCKNCALTYDSRSVEHHGAATSVEATDSEVEVSVSQYDYLDGGPELAYLRVENGDAGWFLIAAEQIDGLVDALRVGQAELRNINAHRRAEA